VCHIERVPIGNTVEHEAHELRAPEIIARKRTRPSAGKGFGAAPGIRALGTHVALPSVDMTDAEPARPFVVLAAVDSTWMAARVERVAASSASARPCAELHFVHVVEDAGETAVNAARLLEDGRSYLERAASKTRHEAPVFVHLRVGKPWEEIVRVAAEIWADLVVVGTHGRSGVPRLLLGSQAEEVVRRASCPVLVVRAASYGTEPPASRDSQSPDGVAHRSGSGPMLIQR
jgi:nucleotide-binding universal stress UspA family protein